MQQSVFHKNQINELKTFIGDTNPAKVFVVRGNKSYASSGAKNFIDNLLGSSNYRSFYEFDPNPQLTDLEKGIDLFKQGNYDLIIAIGGGSVLDMAKLISSFAHQKNQPKEYVAGDLNLENKKTPLLAIPTTAGTGAEATHFAVLYIDKKKYSVAHNCILPDAVYLSAEFSKTASSYLTACTGLDAFSQAIESVWSVNATKESMEFATEAIDLTWKNLKQAVNENKDSAKENMLKAAYLAGKAINITKTTAPHALSYAFTSYYQIPHGHAVAITLPFFLKFNYNLTENDCTDTRGANEVKERISKILNIIDSTIVNSDEKLISFFKELNIEINPYKLITDFNKDIILSNVNLERLSNNPRKISDKSLDECFNQQ